MTQLRKSHGVSITDRKTVKENPKMFTVADGIQIAAIDLQGFKGNEAEIRAMVSVEGAHLPATGHIGLFVDDHIHPVAARDFFVEAQGARTVELKASYTKENPKTHIQIRVAAIGEVNVIGTIEADEMTLVPEAPKPIVQDFHPSLAPVEKPITEEFITAAPPGEAG